MKRLIFFVVLIVAMVMAAGAMAANSIIVEWEFSVADQGKVSEFYIYARPDGAELGDPAVTVDATARIATISDLPDGIYYVSIGAKLPIYDLEFSDGEEFGIVFSGGNWTVPFQVGNPSIVKIRGSVE